MPLSEHEVVIRLRGVGTLAILRIVFLTGAAVRAGLPVPNKLRQFPLRVRGHVGKFHVSALFLKA